MANRPQDATWQLARMVLVHDLGKLFSSQSVNPHQAIADAVGCECEIVKDSRFFYHLRLGKAAGISPAGLKWPAIVDRLQASERIRPAMETWNSALWPFLRGELTPNIGISELLDHHLDRVKFTRVGTAGRLMIRVLERHRGKPNKTIFPVPAIEIARLEDLPNLLNRSIAVTDKLTIAGLVYVEADLASLMRRTNVVRKHLPVYRNSSEFVDAFGPAAKGVWAELRDRLYSGRLSYAYWRRSESCPCTITVRKIILPTDAVDGFLDHIVDEMIHLYPG